MATALLARPNFAAFWGWSSRVFCSHVCACLLGRKRRFHFSPHLFSNDKLPSHIRLRAFPVVSRRNFCVRVADELNDCGSMDSTVIQSMEKKIQEHLNAESVTVRDSYGDGRHVSIDVISTAFEGQSAVNRQRMVYKAIWEELQNTVHAVDQMTTRTPTEAASKK